MLTNQKIKTPGISAKLVTLLLAALLLGQAFAREGWMTDMEAAKKKASREGKDLLIEFTRSEGCGWCIKLEKEVLSKDAFKEQVAKHYVLVTLDFPRDDADWTPGLKKQNQSLLRHYRVRDFPYLVFCDANGRPYTRMSYRRVQGKDFLDQMAGLPEQRKLRDQAFTEAENLEGGEKARMLEKGLSHVSRKYHRHYPEVIAAIAKADPSDACGFVARVRIDQVKTDLFKLLKPHFQKREFSSIPAAVDGFIRDHKPEGEALQVALLFKVQALYTEKKYPAAAKVVDEVIAINDSSRAARYAKTLKKRLTQLK